MITRPVWKLDKRTGAKLKFYASVTDASKDLGRFPVQNIYCCCRGKVKSALGFKWEYATQSEINERNQRGELSYNSADSRRKPLGLSG